MDRYPKASTPSPAISSLGHVVPSRTGETGWTGGAGLPTLRISRTVGVTDAHIFLAMGSNFGHKFDGSGYNGLCPGVQLCCPAVRVQWYFPGHSVASLRSVFFWPLRLLSVCILGRHLGSAV